MGFGGLGYLLRGGDAATVGLPHTAHQPKNGACTTYSVAHVSTWLQALLCQLGYEFKGVLKSSGFQRSDCLEAERKRDRQSESQLAGFKLPSALLPSHTCN